MERSTSLTSAMRALGTVLASVAAVGVAASVVHREFLSDPSPAQHIGSRPLDNWKLVASGEGRTGPADAPVTIVEFVDYQCPACKRYHKLLQALLDEFPDEVAIVYRDLPLEEIHPLAYATAKAVRCATAQGRSKQLRDTLFAQQRELGHKDLVAMAAEAGVADTVALGACLSTPDRHAGIDADIALARELTLRGTPSIVINGTLYGSPPDSLLLFRVVKEEISTRNHAGRDQ